ncbi:MAG: nuclear transport factor 2 family protein, partial [Myxococcota bacterium]
MDTEADVLVTNLAFYAAFAERDLEAMDELWASEHEVACLHPGWTELDGREAVLDSWRRILSNPESPVVRCADAKARVVGDVAWVTCREIL